MTLNPSPTLNRLSYLLARARRLDAASLIARARAEANRFGRSTTAVLVDMLWEAARHDTGFQDFVEFDFAMLTRAERDTFMTNPRSAHLSARFDAQRHRHVFEDKVTFNETFDAFLGREWLRLDESDAATLQAFGTRHGSLITKERRGSQGFGVRRHDLRGVTDWEAFRTELLAGGEVLIEEPIRQHPDLAAVCAGTVNTTRITAYHDGSRTHILSVAQKFGRGAVSDQVAFGGFYTMLDNRGRAMSAGHDSYGRVHEAHPDSGVPIADFRLPLYDEAVALVRRVAPVVPQIAYVGWDIAVTSAGPVLVEGNWGAGVYENKPTVSGIRTGHRRRFRAAMGV